MKNIVIFYPSLERGGATKVLLNLVKYFCKKKINVYLITNKSNNDFKKTKFLKTLIKFPVCSETKSFLSIFFHNLYLNVLK